MGGSSSQLGILARLSVLDASIALSALLLLLQSSRTFLKFSLYFPYRCIKLCVFGLGCRLHFVQWQLLSPSCPCSAECFRCIRCVSSCSYSFRFSLNFLNSFCIFCIGGVESAFLLIWVGLEMLGLGAVAADSSWVSLLGWSCWVGLSVIGVLGLGWVVGAFSLQLLYPWCFLCFLFNLG